ncbi:flagellar basal body rod protein FlgB [bacterium]|nr:flagellar basal body rod protein FlgB [bacterium]
MGNPFKVADTEYLEKALNAASLRQQVISNNIANVNTQGYQGQTVNFEGHLREAMDAEAGNEESAVAGAVDPEFSTGEGGGWTKANLKPTVEAQDGKLNINNEMSSLAKNQIMYNALATKISGVYGALKWVVENSGR